MRSERKLYFRSDRIFRCAYFALGQLFAGADFSSYWTVSSRAVVCSLSESSLSGGSRTSQIAITGFARQHHDDREDIGTRQMRGFNFRSAMKFQMAKYFFETIGRRTAATAKIGIVVITALYLCEFCKIASADDSVDTALIVSVDVSQSVDEDRYKLQMEGIAQAIEDPGVVAAITGGERGAILFSMVTWADKADFALDWRRIASQADASRVAALVRGLPQKGGEFTCLGRMLHSVAGGIMPHIPAHAGRVVIDVSGDGVDNCNDQKEVHAERDAVLATGATINGLPIIVAGENDIVGTGAYRAPGYGLRELSRESGQDGTTLDNWFKEHVVGGPGSFVLAAQGYADFGRAFRRKFVTEVSALVQPLASDH